MKFGFFKSISGQEMKKALNKYSTCGYKSLTKRNKKAINKAFQINKRTGYRIY